MNPILNASLYLAGWFIITVAAFTEEPRRIWWGVVAGIITVMAAMLLGTKLER